MSFRSLLKFDRIFVNHAQQSNCDIKKYCITQELVMPEYPIPHRYGYLTKKSTLNRLMGSMKSGKPCTRFVIEGVGGNTSTIRGHVVCIQEKKVFNPEYEDKCRLIFTMELDEPDFDLIRFLYITDHGDRDHIHFDVDVIGCENTERKKGWPDPPHINRLSLIHI